MIGQAQFTLRSRNPDVLTCIANLSNDEVFMPPEFASHILDTLAAAWVSRRSMLASPAESRSVFLRTLGESHLQRA